jgi:hypothetical protein
MDEQETATVEAPAEVATPEVMPEEPKQEVPAEVKKALQKANKEAEQLRLKLKEFEDRDKTDAQRLQEDRDALKAERDALLLETLRREVADEKGLTPAQAKRLVGMTREELESDADDVLAVFPVKAAPRIFGDVGQGVRGDGSGKRIYTTAEIKDFQFWTANRSDIELAQREGRVIDS